MPVITPAAHGHDVVLGLGVGAVRGNEIVVKIAGRDTHVKLARLPEESDAARLYLHCLVAKHVIRVDPKRGRAWTLDEVEVSERVRRYLDDPSSGEPCDAASDPNAPLPRVQRKKGT